MTRKLITGGYVVTVDPARNVFPGGYVAIDGAKIAAVGPSAQAPKPDGFDEVIDARGCIVLPGLINMHQHHWYTLFKGLADGMLLEDWVTDFLLPLSLKLDGDAMAVSSTLAGLEMLATGTTCSLNHSVTTTTPDLVKASIVLAITYGAGAALVAVLASDDRFGVAPLSAFIAALSVALVAGTVGVLVESGAGEDILDATPDWLRDAVPAGLAAAAALIVAGGLMVALSLVLRFGTATDLIESLKPGPVGAVVLFALCAVMVPNAIVYAVAFLAGPGFQVGTGTVVAPTGVQLGNLPALPLLAALPEDGATPTYLLALTASVPLLAGVVAGLVLARRGRQAAYRNMPLGWPGLIARALVAGLVAGLALLAAMVLASGSAGPGRMADVGVADLLTAAMTPAAGVALGAVAAGLLAIRRRPI